MIVTHPGLHSCQLSHNSMTLHLLMTAPPHNILIVGGLTVLLIVVAVWAWKLRHHR